MARGFRTNLRTSSAPQHPPFKVEVVNNRDILCHVGRVYDPASSGGQYLQKSWDATQSKFTTKGLPNTRLGKVELKYTNYNVKTGSSVIYYKGNNTTASHGRATSTNATHPVGENGYVRWLRSQAPENNYIVLHKDGTKWCISAVEEEDVTTSDIVLAYIFNGLTVRQVWKSDISGLNDENYPFKISVSGNKISVQRGTINSIACEESGTYANGNWSIYGNAVFGTGNFGNIQNAYITVANGSYPDDDTTGKILIGDVQLGGQNGTKIYQYVSGSQHVDRFKCSSAGIAQYFWNLV